MLKEKNMQIDPIRSWVGKSRSRLPSKFDIPCSIFDICFCLHFFLCVLCAFVVNSSSARAQKAALPSPGDEMIDKYLAQETDKISQRFLDGAKTLEEWQGKLPRLRQEYLYMLGLSPLPEKTPLHATITGTLERDNVIIDKLHFQSRPGLYVTGNLYRPGTDLAAGQAPRLPAILYVCGHSGRGRDGNKTAFQDHGMWFASNGYICLVIDTLQLGEIPGIHHGTYREGRWWWQARGYTPAGVECWNGIRAIDYLVSRPDVDPERIGVTGISGGGAATIWIAAADERVKCAVPVSGMSDLESYVKNKIINYHCDCMLMINTYGWEWTTIAALIAPRPMLFCNSDNDTIFPMDANRRIADRLRRLYKMYDKPELFDDYVSKGGHDYRPDLRLAIFKWINKHLKNDTGPIKDADFKAIAGKELRVFAEDKDVPKDSINAKIDETFVPKAEVKLPVPGKFEEWKRNTISKIRSSSFRTFPPHYGHASFEGTNRSEGAIIESEPGIVVTYSLNSRDQSPPVLVILDQMETDKNPAWANNLVGEGAVVRLTTRGCFLRPWTTKSPPNYVERAHALVGLTVDQGRVSDIIAEFQVATRRHKKKESWKVVGRGQSGILGVYAALFEPEIKEVIIVDPPVSHRDGPIFLNVMRVLDIPEALGLLAPRPLTLINAKDKAFDRTAEIYKLAGAADKFQRK
jgi:cephalosporin-C deacetylase-like acetyl esterase